MVRLETCILSFRFPSRFDCQESDASGGGPRFYHPRGFSLVRVSHMLLSLVSRARNFPSYLADFVCISELLVYLQGFVGFHLHGWACGASRADDNCEPASCP